MLIANIVNVGDIFKQKAKNNCFLNLLEFFDILKSLVYKVFRTFAI